MDEKKHSIKPRHFRSAVVTIHDVMPESLSRVSEIILFLNLFGIRKYTLLVVPGKDWTASQLRQLRTFQETGGVIAGHGWQHRAVRKTSLCHKLHGKMMSRNAAEHLSLNENEIIDIIRHAYRWFIEHGFGKPDLYVPPAWAMGNIRRSSICKLPFRFYEYQSGILNKFSKKFHLMPVVGYMADTPMRAWGLKALNFSNLALPFPCVRIAIHPEDLTLPLNNDLKQHLGHFQFFTTYFEIINRLENGTFFPVRPAKAEEHTGVR